MWDAFTSPSGGAQQEPTEPGAPKSDFHTSSRSRTHPAPLAGEKQSIKQVWLWRVRGVRRPKEAFIQDSALFQTSPEVATSGKQFLPPSLTHRGQGCYFEEDTISVCKTSCAPHDQFSKVKSQLFRKKPLYTKSPIKISNYFLFCFTEILITGLVLRPKGKKKKKQENALI